MADACPAGGRRQCQGEPVGAGATDAVRRLCAKHLKAQHPRTFAAWKREQDAPQEPAAPLALTAAERLAAPPADEDPAETLDEPERELRAGDVITPTGRLIGYTEPRIFTPALRPLTRQTSLGFEFADFCDLVLGKPLLPWQRWLGIHALELTPDTETTDEHWRFRFKVVLVLVARQNGKSDFSRSLKLYKLFVLRMRLIIGTAQDLDVARKMLSLTNELIDEVDGLAEEKVSYITANGKEKLALTDGREYVLKASNKKAGRGPSADHVDMDELREHHDWGAWGALSKTTRARRNAQLWGFSNAGDDESVVLNQLQSNAQAGTSKQTFIAEYSAPEGCELGDEAAICQANPALGYLFDEDSIWSDLENDPPEVFRTEVLCQRVEQLDGAVSLNGWKNCADPSGSLADLRDRIVMCLDVAPDGTHVTLVGAGQIPNGCVRLEVLGAWGSPDECRGELAEIVTAIKPVVLGWLPVGPAAVLGNDLRALAKSTRKTTLTELTGAEVLEACQELAEQVSAGKLAQPSDPLLDAHIAGAKKLRTGDGWRFVRRGAGHVDGAYAAAGAVHILRGLPPAAPKRKLVV